MILSIAPINNTVQYNRPNFTGRGKLPKFSQCYDSFEFSSPNKIIKRAFNYTIEQGSRVTLPYKGPKSLQAGFSTEAPDLGGGWLLGSVETPLSTTGVRTCAVMNLVNEETAEQVLYHVFHATSVNRIEKFIREIFPDFTRVNIVGGDQFQTVNTIRKIINAVDNVDPYAPKVYYEAACENPQFVAFKNEIFYMKGKSGQLSFIPNTENYWY